MRVKIAEIADVTGLGATFGSAALSLVASIPQARSLETIGFKFTYSLNSKLVDRAHCLDRGARRSNAVTNRQYRGMNDGAIRMKSRHAGNGMDAMLAGSAAQDLLPSGDAGLLDSVEGMSAAKFCGRQMKRGLNISAPRETQFVSGKVMGHGRWESFAGWGALRLSGTRGQKEYHADF